MKNLQKWRISLQDAEKDSILHQSAELLQDPKMELRSFWMGEGLNYCRNMAYHHDPSVNKVYTVSDHKKLVLVDLEESSRMYSVFDKRLQDLE